MRSLAVPMGVPTLGALAILVAAPLQAQMRAEKADIPAASPFVRERPLREDATVSFGSPSVVGVASSNGAARPASSGQFRPLARALRRTLRRRLRTRQRTFAQPHH